MNHPAKEKHDAAAQHILEKIMGRRNWGADVRDAIAATIGTEVDKATRKIRGDLEKSQAELRSARAQYISLKHGPVAERKRRRLNG